MAETDLGASSPAASDARAHAGTVLHVEDNETNRYVRRRALQAAGFRVIEAASAAEAWELLLRERPEVVLLDVQLPDGDGYELTRRIKGHLAVATTRVILISALFTDSESRVRGLDSGADSYIIEPMEPAELVAVVRSKIRGRRTEDLLYTILDSSPMLIAGADADGRVALFNAACEALTGYSRSDVIGRPFVDTLVAPEDREVVRRKFRESSTAELARPHESHWRTAAGANVLIEWRSSSVTAPDGQTWTLGIGHDVTARHDMELALRFSEYRLQTIIDSTPALVYVVDERDRFRLVNRQFAEIFGLDPVESTGRSIYDYFPRETADEFAAHNHQVLATNTRCEFEEVVQRPDGPHTYISVKAPLYSDQGVAYAVCGVSTDITERQRLLSELEVAQRQKDAFIATIAHELGQPLGAIQVALALMRNRVDREKGEHARSVVERQVTQLSRLVGDLMDAARLSQGKLALRLERVQVGAIIEAAVHVVQPSLEERQLRLAIRVPEEPVWLTADPARLQQVFSNLLTNAAKFTDAGGQLGIRVEVTEGAVAVHVSDTGRGIAPDALPQVFDLFSQAAPGEGGLGIGLAVVRRLVEEHGGTVEVSSEGIGKGTEFTVRLPLATSGRGPERGATISTQTSRP
jgi:PAS domain S-box-containing protein